LGALNHYKNDIIHLTGSAPPTWSLKDNVSHKRTKPPGAQRTYGILVGKIQDGQQNEEGRSPHYEIWVKGNGDYRIAVNVQSVDGSDVLALFDSDFKSPTKLDLPTLAAGALGFTPLPTGPNGKGLDYLRDNLFPIDKMAPIPPEGAGVTLANLLDAQIERAKADDEAIVLACGEFFQDRGRDQNFKFSPERGVHDIHMMQGNSGSFANDNRVNGDGALFIRYAGGECVALFVRFTVQDIPTDDTTGSPVAN
jgi:uncharacterized protein YukJ